MPSSNTPPDTALVRVFKVQVTQSYLKLLPLNDIERGVRTFLEFAASSFDTTFHVTPIACGLVVFQPKDIAPMFREAPANCILPERSIDILHR